jgi:hypothetical protein
MVGGEAKAWIALSLAFLLLLAGVHEHPIAVLYGSVSLLLLSVLYFVYGRVRVTLCSPEEELRALRGEIKPGS